jgi:hypothetical protein
MKSISATEGFKKNYKYEYYNDQVINNNIGCNTKQSINNNAECDYINNDSECYIEDEMKENFDNPNRYDDLNIYDEQYNKYVNFKYYILSIFIILFLSAFS